MTSRGEAGQGESPWWSDLAIAGCSPPFLPPRECRTCLRVMHATTPAVEPLLDKQGLCLSAIPSDDPLEGYPW